MWSSFIWSGSSDQISSSQPPFSQQRLLYHTAVTTHEILLRRISGVVARGHQEVCQLSQLVLGEGGHVLYPVVGVGPLPVLDCLLDGGLNRIILMITAEKLIHI